MRLCDFIPILDTYDPEPISCKDISQLEEGWKCFLAGETSFETRISELDSVIAASC